MSRGFRLIFWAWLLLVFGCASVPEPIRTELPAGSPTVAATRANPEQYLGAHVRWGGSIAGVTNGRSDTTVEIVSRELSESTARPRGEGGSGGRFLARFEGFLDPAIYAVGRDITVVGTLEAPERRAIGEYEYLFPVVRVRSHQLWEPLPQTPPGGYYRYDPWWDPWYSPFYDPWYPFHPWYHSSQPLEGERP